jgi:ketosteroid isomerase-like protein
MTASEFEQVVQRFQDALDAFFRGDAEPAKKLMSRHADVTLLNPFHPIARGWQQVEETMDGAGSNYREGGATGFETVTTYVTANLAYTVWIERFRAKVGARDEPTAGAHRRTTIYRRESDSWQIVHTHADPIVTPQPAESIIPT